jgi:hypothetical protein
VARRGNPTRLEFLQIVPGIAAVEQKIGGSSSTAVGELSQVTLFDDVIGFDADASTSGV